MTIHTIQKQNVVNAVYEQMIEKILDGTWEVGSKLPSEKELTILFNVSRVSIRSSIQKLRDLGVVTTSQGKGSFISSTITKEQLSTATTPIMNLSHDEFQDMKLFREVVDFKCIELAAIYADEDDIKELEEALNQMLLNKNDYKKYTEADFNFHLSIAKASKNKVFYHIIYSIRDTYKYYLEELNRVLGVTLESIDAHIKVFMAIKNHNVQDAISSLDNAMKSNSMAIEKLQKN
ncbi:GntR family transcriptional regulator [Gallibacterium genomosp. 3]|uniref:GntR family transcriptional regulator n=1 Tax=Gallibacterium genomosp. 3 TaxID=505345 RepID=A0A1A7NKC6_9PAST|nr:FadR/GntR family transcriptional regulator [Gallibacterium genomosp. 3]OBW90617.1 GntR family transcriptional regulator [Gallibacterium genomosp. 3]